jgi:uncharacterized protein (TIGR03118 family)
MFRTKRRRPTLLHSARPRLEALEDRCLLDANVLQTNLVSDLPGVAKVQDPNLVNPWGISESGGSPFWISDNGAGVSTLYNGQGVPQPQPTPTNPNATPLVVNIPSPDDPNGGGAPTGTVFNTTLTATGGGFVVSKGGKSAPAIFLFATEDGLIAGWAPSVDPTHAVTAVPNSSSPASDAVYKGLAIGTDANGRTLLYASNFRSGKIDVFGTDFAPVTTLPAGAFTDSDLPKGYAPFNVQVLGNKVYVTYAKQDAAKHDDVAGPGHGFVDVFNLDGSPGLSGGKERLVSRGPLDSPWGLALAPASFGSLSGALLVGNFGNGHINAFNATTGAFLGALKDPDGEPITIDGLWALQVGNGHTGGDADKVYFTAGLFHESHGLFGSLAPVAAGTPEGQSEAQLVQAAVDVFQLALTTVQQDIASGASASQLTQDLQALNAALIQLVQIEVQFAADARRDARGTGDHSSAQGMDMDTLEDLVDNLVHHGHGNH